MLVKGKNEKAPSERMGLFCFHDKSTPNAKKANKLATRLLGLNNQRLMVFSLKSLG